MAERRMFAKTIVDSDAFLDMPLSTQALYFHLSMRADDEGFVNNPKKIQRVIGATDDDLRILESKNFIIPFESGIVVIKHWRIHNYIRADRLVETKYKEERELLQIKDNGAYTFNEDLKQIEMLDSTDLRKKAYSESTLPYSFSYKIRRAFYGRLCPVCQKEMTSAYLCNPTIQHNTPISMGGVHEIENISVICESCNCSLRDTPTNDLNNAEVVAIWDKIKDLENKKIKWFDNPKILWQTDDGQVTDISQTNVGVGKDRLDKDSTDKDIGKKKKQFVPPTLEEVTAYCKERKNNVNPKAFFDYYQAGHWVDSKGAPVRNWKQKVITWEKDSRSPAKPKTNNIESHDYDFNELERILSQ